jgi:acyl carrier protein
MTTTFDWIHATLVQDYKLDPPSLTLDASLETLGIDSLAVAELLFNVEDKFHITVSPDSAPLSTLGDVVRFIDAHIAAQHGAGKSELGRSPASPSP